MKMAAVWMGENASDKVMKEMDADVAGLAITHSTALPLYKTFKTV